MSSNLISARQDAVFKRHRIIATLAMIGSAACWGGATVMSRDLLNEIEAPTLLVVQLMASVVALLLLSLPHRPWRYASRHLAIASLTGIFEPGMTYSIGLWGLSLSTASNAAIIGSTEPLFIILIAWIFLRFKPSRKLLICISVAICGLFLVSSSSFGGASFRSIYGDLLIVTATIFAAAYVVVSSRFIHRFPAAVLASAQQIVGLLCTLLFYFLFKFFGDVKSILGLDIGLFLYASLSGMVQYALAFWLYLIGLKYLSPGAAGLWLTLVPVFAIVGAYFWLSEIPTFMMFGGMGLILCAVLIGGTGDNR